MMEAFATRYCDCNPGVFQSTGTTLALSLHASCQVCRLKSFTHRGFVLSVPTDTCYILSFAIIMLNTSLHNPNVKDKPSLQRFVSMNRGINNGNDLSVELLTVC